MINLRSVAQATTRRPARRAKQRGGKGAKTDRGRPPDLIAQFPTIPPAPRLGWSLRRGNAPLGRMNRGRTCPFGRPCGAALLFRRPLCDLPPTRPPAHRTNHTQVYSLADGAGLDAVAAVVGPGRRTVVVVAMHHGVMSARCSVARVVVVCVCGSAQGKEWVEVGVFLGDKNVASGCQRWPLWGAAPPPHKCALECRWRTQGLVMDRVKGSLRPSAFARKQQTASREGGKLPRHVSCCRLLA